MRLPWAGNSLTALSISGSVNMNSFSHAAARSASQALFTALLEIPLDLLEGAHALALQMPPARHGIHRSGGKTALDFQSIPYHALEQFALLFGHEVKIPFRPAVHKAQLSRVGHRSRLQLRTEGDISFSLFPTQPFQFLKEDLFCFLCRHRIAFQRREGTNSATKPPSSAIRSLRRSLEVRRSVSVASWFGSELVAGASFQRVAV